jgi:hypothetical protein
MDRQLLLQQRRLRLNGRRRLERLHQVSPLGLLSTGLITGLLAGYLMSDKGYYIYAMLRGGMRLCRLSGCLPPGAALDSVEYPE